MDCLRNNLSISKKITVNAIKDFCFIRLGRPLKHSYFLVKQYHFVLIFSVRKLSKKSFCKSSDFFMAAVDFILHEHCDVCGEVFS